MTDYVRARVNRDGGSDLSRTTSRQRAEAAGWDVLDEPTHSRDGRIRPDTTIDGRAVKPKTSVAQAAAEKADESAKKSDTKPSKKES